MLENTVFSFTSGSGHQFRKLTFKRKKNKVAFSAYRDFLFIYLFLHVFSYFYYKNIVVYSSFSHKWTILRRVSQLCLLFS